MSNFDLIYQAAQDAVSLEDLKTKLAALSAANKELYLDEKQQDGNPYLTPAAQLAKEGYERQVEWLRQLGASVDAIALGFAMGGRHLKVEEYRSKYGASVHAIAQGYVLAEEGDRYHKQVDEYLTQHGASADLIAQAYAVVGNAVKVQFYWQTQNANIQAIFLGYALAKNQKKVRMHESAGIPDGIMMQGYIFAGDNETVTKCTKSGVGQQELHCMALAYAMVGNHEQVAECLRLDERCSDGSGKTNINDYIAYGYASVGNHSKVKEYRNKAPKPANLKHIIEAYAKSGYDQMVEQYCALPGISVSHLRKTYRDAGKTEEHFARVLLRGYGETYLTQRTAQRDAAGKTKEYLRHRLFPGQKSFAQKQHAEKLLMALVNGESCDITADDVATLRNGSHGKQLRKFVKAGYLNELAGKKVNTVRDFIQALQEKNKLRSRLSTYATASFS